MGYHCGDYLIDPHVLYRKVHLSSGAHIADFGCGKTGHIIFPAARIIGESGMIYAVDILKDSLLSIRNRARSESYTNVHTVWSNIEHPGATAIPEKTLDIVFLVNTVHQVTNIPAVLAEVTRLMKPKSRLLIVDWKMHNLPYGPRRENLVNMEYVLRWARQKHMALQEYTDVGPYHHGVVLYQHE